MVTPPDSTAVIPAGSAASETIISPNTQSRMKIPGDQVRRAIQDLPADQQSDIWWFYRYTVNLDLGRSELGGLLKKPNAKPGPPEFYSGDSIVQLLTGGRMRRGENIEPMLEAIATLRGIEGIRETQINSGFIETRLFLEIEKRCLRALHRQRIGFIFGDSQIGKTASLEEVQRRHNHGQTILIEIPAIPTLMAVLCTLARAFAIPANLNMRDLAERVISAFDGTMLLLVDEVHRILASRYSQSGIQVFSFFRELYNRRKCGMVFSMTNEGRDNFRKGPHAKALEQLWRRRITPLQLPAFPPDDDALLFAEAYGLPPAPDQLISVTVTAFNTQGRKVQQKLEENPLAMQRAVLKAEGLGVWIGILQDAADMAVDSKRQITWAAVIKARAQSLADGEIYQ